MRIWNLESNTVRVLRGHKNSITSLAVLSDNMMASGRTDTTIKIWKPHISVLIRTLIGHTKHVNTLVVVQDGRLASGSNDKTIRIWNIDTGSSIKLEGHTARISSLVVLPDGLLGKKIIENLS